MTFTPKHLGKTTEYPTTFDASLLEAIPRSFGRDELGIDESALPFIGTDVWQAYEVSWLSVSGQGVAGVLSLIIPAQSFAIVESKSLKLYLQSFHMTKFSGVAIIQAQIEKDLSALLKSEVKVSVQKLEPGLLVAAADNMWPVQSWQGLERTGFNPVNLDALEFQCSIYEPSADVLRAESFDTESTQFFITDCFRSLCPVTGQPDFASLLVMTEGVTLDSISLGQYFNSYRLHQGFHEQCVETIFLDILALGAFKKLSVIGRFTRRGGIDINPERHLNTASDEHVKGLQLRQVRQ